MKKTVLALGVPGALAVLILVYAKKGGTVRGSAPTVPSAFQATSGGLQPGTAASVLPAAAISATDLEKGKILDEILRSKNDNDPRLDTVLKSLSEGAKSVFRQKYAGLAAERLNEKGTIVFLLGRNMSSAQDFSFMEKVLRESPCLSLADCSRETPGKSGSDIGADEVTAAYPQMVALNSLERYLSGGANTQSPELAAMDLSILKGAMSSRVAIVARKAAQLYSQLSNPH